MNETAVSSVVSFTKQIKSLKEVFKIPAYRIWIEDDIGS